MTDKDIEVEATRANRLRDAIAALLLACESPEGRYCLLLFEVMDAAPGRVAVSTRLYSDVQHAALAPHFRELATELEAGRVKPL